jgi:hypothetical protein
LIANGINISGRKINKALSKNVCDASEKPTKFINIEEG